MDSARVYFRNGLAGFEHLHAHFKNYRYPRHAHACIVIGLVDEGLQSYTYRGALHRTGRDGIFFVNAGEAHTGEPAHHEGYSYRAIQLDDSYVANWLRPAGIRCLAFKEAVIRSRELARELRRALLAIESGRPALRCEELVLTSIRNISSRFAYDWVEKAAKSPGRRTIEQVCEFIASSRIEDLSLARLSGLAGMSVFHFAHSFRRQVGCSPFMYAEAIRIERAKGQLRGDAHLADIAFDLGYTDQSHFTRKFKHHQGVTPGRYRASCRRIEAAVTRVEGWDKVSTAYLQ